MDVSFHAPRVSIMIIARLSKAVHPFVTVARATGQGYQRSCTLREQGLCQDEDRGPARERIKSEIGGTDAAQGVRFKKVRPDAGKQWAMINTTHSHRLL